MTTNPLVLVAGNVTRDRLDAGYALGGSVYYCAQTYHRLGARVRVATAAGRYFADDSAFAGMRTVCERKGRTLAFQNSYAPDGSRLQTCNASPIKPPLHSVPHSWQSCDVLHLAPVMGEIDLAEWASRFHARFVAIGVQGWLRSVDGQDHRVMPHPWNISGDELRKVDVAFLSDEDLEGQGDLFNRLTDNVPLVLLTHGRRGSTLFCGGTTQRIPAFETTEVDATGAGDVFSAGFMYGLVSGASPVEAANLGAAAASIIVEDIGGKAFGRMSEAKGRVRKLSMYASDLFEL